MRGLILATMMAVMLAAGPTLAQQPDKQAIAQQNLDQWDTYAILYQVAHQCPILEPWKMYAVRAAMLRRQNNLAALNAPVDFAARFTKFDALISPLPCSDPQIAGQIATAQHDVAAAFIDLGGWYGDRQESCYVQEVSPAAVKAEIDRMVQTFPDLKGLTDFWAGQTKQVKDAQCPKTWREPYVGDMLFQFKLTGDPGVIFKMPIPADSKEAGLQAFRDARIVTDNQKPLFKVSANASQAFMPNASWGWDLQNRLVGNIAPTTSGPEGFGVELRQFDSPDLNAKPVKVFKPVRELPAVTIKDTWKPRRTWQFGPEAEAAINTAPAGTYFSMALDMNLDNGAGRTLEERTHTNLGQAQVRWPAADLRRARRWANEAGPVGKPLKP